MEVGIEDCLHIEFEYSKGRYALADTVVGKIYFLLVRIRLKHMEIEIRRRETTGASPFLRPAPLCTSGLGETADVGSSCALKSRCTGHQVCRS